MTQPEIGILMLNTSFDRPIGDIGNPATYPFPVSYEIVESATISRVVKAGDRELITPFVLAAKKLQRKGVKAITTSCGFLALFQQEIQQELSVPFFSSSLMQIPLISLMTGGSVGVLTAREASLTSKHLFAVNAHQTPIIIEGMDDMPAFTEAIVDETKPLDMEAIAFEMKFVTQRLIKKHPAVKSILLECTNMPPYRNAMREITDLPIFDINTLANYIYNAVDSRN